MRTNVPDYRMRDGTSVADPRLDELFSWDDRNEAFLMEERLDELDLAPRSYTWRVDTWLDQGREGACVGFAHCHELAARPNVVMGITNQYAQGYYKRCQQIDEWPGEAYSGTSVLAGAKVMKERGFITEYRWATTVDDVRRTVGNRGPVIIGVRWYEGMYRPNSKGYVEPTGRVLGRHAILVHANSETNRCVTLWNSWGQGWGVNGTAKLSHASLGVLLEQNGVCMVPEGRTAIRTVSVPSGVI